MNTTLSNRFRHYFHVISNVRPLYWMCLYVVLVPLFALVYWSLPDNQFRIPDGSGTDFGSWIYYSIVTITTLGFGDYTPSHIWAQFFTAVEVTCGLLCMGFFLNSVGAMKSEIDVDAEVEKQRMLHQSQEEEKLKKTIPTVLHLINTFLSFCYATTTPSENRKEISSYRPDFEFRDLKDMYHPSHIPGDNSRRPAVTGLLKSAFRTSLALDSLQTNIDLTLWPELLENCFTFVANYQMFASADDIQERMIGLAPDNKNLSMQTMEKKISDEIGKIGKAEDAEGIAYMEPVIELYNFIKENASIALRLETSLTRIASPKE